MPGLPQAGRIRVLRDESPFNYSSLNTRGAREARHGILCLMNNAIEILAPDWLEEMVSFAVRADTGAVGARLWYPDALCSFLFGFSICSGVAGVIGPPVVGGEVVT